MFGIVREAKKLSKTDDRPYAVKSLAKTKKEG